VISNSHSRSLVRGHHTRVNLEGCVLILLVLVLPIGFVAFPASSSCMSSSCLGAFFTIVSYCSGVSSGSLRTNALILMGDTPGRHARHFHAVFDDPELFGRSTIGLTPELRRAWI
jgi:hypothetical protein